MTKLESPALHVNLRGIWSRSVGGSVNIAASMDTSPISADTNQTSQNRNLPKRLLLMVNPSPKERKRKEEKKKQKKLLNWLKLCHSTHLLIVVTMKHNLLMATILPKVKLQGECRSTRHSRPEEKPGPMSTPA